MFKVWVLQCCGCTTNMVPAGSKSETTLQAASFEGHWHDSWAHNSHNKSILLFWFIIGHYCIISTKCSSDM
jgi:hypothetical protein